MAAPSPDASAAPSPLHETARGPPRRRPSSRPAPTSATQSVGIHLRPPSPPLEATTPYGTVPPPSSRVLMPWKGSTQVNVFDQRTFSDKQHLHSQSQWSHDFADNEHWSTENMQEPVNLGTTKRARWSHQMKLYLIDLLKEHDVPGFRTQNAWDVRGVTSLSAVGGHRAQPRSGWGTGHGRRPDFDRFPVPAWTNSRAERSAERPTERHGRGGRMDLADRARHRREAMEGTGVELWRARAVAGRAARRAGRSRRASEIGGWECGGGALVLL